MVPGSSPGGPTTFKTLVSDSKGFLFGTEMKNCFRLIEVVRLEPIASLSRPLRLLGITLEPADGLDEVQQ